MKYCWRWFNSFLGVFFVWISGMGSYCYLHADYSPHLCCYYHVFIWGSHFMLQGYMQSTEGRTGFRASYMQIIEVSTGFISLYMQNTDGWTSFLALYMQSTERQIGFIASYMQSIEGWTGMKTSCLMLFISINHFTLLWLPLPAHPPPLEIDLYW